VELERLSQRVERDLSHHLSLRREQARDISRFSADAASDTKPDSRVREDTLKSALWRQYIGSSY